MCLLSPVQKDINICKNLDHVPCIMLQDIKNELSSLRFNLLC